MTAEWSAADEPFFREWNAFRAARKRSLDRARVFAGRIGITLNALPPCLVVVGSKGKGTAVAYATLALCCAGLRVGTISSPPLRTNRERIRLNGIALSEVGYEELSREVAAVVDGLPEPTDGYLSPTGIFTLAGLSHLIRRGVDVLVLEEGLGGASDEISLIAPEIVAVTRIFEEHLGVIGADVAEIAGDLLGVVKPETMQVHSLDQDQFVADIVADRSGERVRPPLTQDWQRAATASVPGLSRENALLGLTAGTALALIAGRDVDTRLATAIGARMQLPGRLSVHVTAAARLVTWVVDAAINPAGIRAALAWMLENVGNPGIVVASFPDTKAVASCWAELRGRNVVPVEAGESYLTFDQRSAPAPLVQPERAFSIAAASGGPVLCLGTMSFIGDVMEHLRVPTESYWR